MYDHARILTAFLMVVIMSVFLISCAGSQQATPAKSTKTRTAKYVRFYDKTNRFSLEFPGHWEVRQYKKGIDRKLRKGMRLVFRAISPLEKENDAFRERIGVVVVKLDPSEMEGSNDPKPLPADLNLVKEVGYTRIQDHLAGWHESRKYYSKDGKLMLKQYGIDITVGDKKIKIGWVGEAKKLARYNHIIWRIAKSIRFK